MGSAAEDGVLTLSVLPFVGSVPSALGSLCTVGAGFPAGGAVAVRVTGPFG